MFASVPDLNIISIYQSTSSVANNMNIIYYCLLNETVSRINSFLISFDN